MNVISFEDRVAARLGRRAAAYGMDVVREPGGTWALVARGFKTPELSGVTLREIAADLNVCDEQELQPDMSEAQSCGSRLRAELAVPVILERVRIGTLSAPANTALRDIDDLVRRRVLAKDPAGGRKTSHSLILG